MYTIIRLSLFLLLAVGPFFAEDARCSVLEEVVADFRPISGAVIMPVENEFLIDLDSGAGLNVGDLVAVIKPGKMVVHPVTKEELGALDEVKGLLKVTRIRSGYSFAVPVGEVKGIEAGDSVRRYEYIPATFWDYTGQGKEFFSDLKVELVNLEWQEYAAAQADRPEVPTAPLKSAPLLMFVLSQDGLDVRGVDFQVLQSYPLPETLQLSSPAIPSLSPVKVDGASLPRSVSRATTPSESQSGELKDHWVSHQLDGEAVGVEVADLDGDGLLEIATLFPHRLEISRYVEDSYSHLTSLDLGFGQKALSLDGVDLDGNGKAELYVTAATEGGLASLVVECSADSCTIEKGGIPWYFRMVSLPGEGRVLLAQAMGNLDNDFIGPLFRVRADADGLAKGAQVEVPGNLDLYGFAPVPVPDGQDAYAYLNDWDRLQILSVNGRKLWEVGEHMGGSEVHFERTDPSLVENAGGPTRNVYIPARIEIGREGDILLPVNEGVRLLGQARRFKSSYLKAMKWDGRKLRKSWQTQPQDGYMVDFRVADYDNDGNEEVITATVLTRTSIMSRGSSIIVTYELN